LVRLLRICLTFASERTVRDILESYSRGRGSWSMEVQSNLAHPSGSRSFVEKS
jgi:hypothetical protein